ncbi:hypothetical protein GLOIN_2v1739352 [Rhizophagus clarus]|uniref:Uncharacterized protein n=1 Tax=Rhizophagus clarus TaxID=94130 RepID=A0A8H3KS63_9GLOM|nr:hypothetical protein GLOIN_2v1739352 [Rhizophagus clarus]
MSRGSALIDKLVINFQDVHPFPLSSPAITSCSRRHCGLSVSRRLSRGRALLALQCHVSRRIVDLEAENAELKAENAEIPELRKKFVEVEAKNAKLETENFEVKAEIMKLRAELKSGIEELEKSRTDTVAENARRDIESVKLKARVAKSVAVQLKKHMSFGENVESEALPEVTVTASPSFCEEDRKTDEFLDLVQKKSVSDGIRHRKRKEKPQHETAEIPKDQEASTISQNISSGCFGGTESEQNDELISPLEKNLIVEQELIQQLSTTINNDEVSSIFRRNTGLVDLVPSLVSTQSIVHMFREAIRSGQNAILFDHVTKINKIRGNEDHVTSRIESTESSSQAYIPPGLKAISDEKVNTLDTSQARLDHNDEESIEVRRGIHVEENSVAFLRNNPNGIFDQSDLV